MRRADDTPVRASLDAAARELERIADLGRDMQEQLSPLLRATGATLTAAQGLDELVQQVEGLAQFLDALAPQCSDAWSVSPGQAAARLGLAAQRRRLADDAAPTPTNANSAGELDLF